ncbi:MAG: cytochrome-c peroxidase [Chitinophagales bacterium]
MRYWTYLFALSVFFITACSSEQTSKSLEDREHIQYNLALQDHFELYGNLPLKAENPNNKITDEKVELGRLLYFDKRLSKDGTVSCNSCHNLETFGVDNLPTSPGVGGTLGPRNSPTVFNAALHKSQFWDGRAKDVEEQAGMPILNPIEMAIPSEEFLIERLSQIPLYKEKFSEAFPEEESAINYENLKKAIAVFERLMITPSSFDEYLAGDSSALTLKQKKGMMTFSLVGCTTCHAGRLLGGELLQKFGVYYSYWDYTGSKNIDEGLFEVTKNETEKYIFKVPSLRNVAKTAPYFHDGSVDTLEKAVQIMAITQLDVKLSDSEVENIVAFLNALTSDIPDELKEVPEALKDQEEGMTSL